MVRIAWAAGRSKMPWFRVPRVTGLLVASLLVSSFGLAICASHALDPNNTRAKIADPALIGTEGSITDAYAWLVFASKEEPSAKADEATD